MTTLKLANDRNGGLDLVFDEKNGRFVMDQSLNSNMLVSIFFEKRVIETTIQAVIGVGGWAGSNALPESEILGSTVWYEIRNKRLSENTKILIENAIYAALQWAISGGYVDTLTVTADLVKSKGQVSVRIEYLESVSLQQQVIEVNV
jgi:phage gp46-like protein